MSSDKNEHILMAHGAGGEVMKELIHDLILKHLAGGQDSVEVGLSALDDSAVLPGDIVFTTDSHTVRPLFFPGGDIGSLSIAGTVNDLSVMGARPMGLTLGMVVEEGFSREELERVIASTGKSAQACGVPVVAGDTKVVERGGVDKLITNTAGVGVRHPLLDSNFERVAASRPVKHRWPLDSNIADGDVIILSGTVGDHGIALVSVREGYEFTSNLVSDVAPLNIMIEKALEVGGIAAMKDPTRGGLSNSLNEWAEKSGIGIKIIEEDIPLDPAVVAACDMLGFDPLEIGNEGKCVLAVVPEAAEEILKALRATPEGANAAIIGEAASELKGVAMATKVGGLRVVEAPIGDPIPRIC